MQAVSFRIDHVLKDMSYMYIYISKYVSLHEPTEKRKGLILCEIFHDITIITAQAYCSTVALF